MNQTAQAVHEIQDSLPGPRAVLADGAPIALESGATLGPVTVAYQTWGTLNAERNNAVLICHALTGDQFVVGTHPLTGKPGWWEQMVGPGKPVDTDRYFVICPNCLGGCLGTTGPAAVNPETGELYGTSFPVITIRDMVNVQALLMDQLGIEKIMCVIGGSMGGMQVLEWAARHRERVVSAVSLAGAARHSAQNIAFHEVGRQAIMADPDWCDGFYYNEGKRPESGLSVARMAAHITYLSEPALWRKFGRALQDRYTKSFGFGADFQVESYLRHQGASFVQRFDANAYLYITRAMDYFDLEAEFDGDLASAWKDIKTRFLLVSFTSDWLFPTSESKTVVRSLNRAGANVSFVEIESDKGHDAFLLDEPDMFATTRGFLDSVARDLGV
ncbi:MAG: homoserine O-acetyltransferase [Rhodospirillaceae bacterium]|jgi:homoserine O-acetyltransferase/O-succinyltransferase|nr:homoserine O-acetyltransferase [Rhodospirillaceae bacterium]MBT6206134.1 homoserine O-acetyltransferase [Rhodospirillaceae bacterium]MBT6512333.1 homoserine O-acetyltransferase [Rhodospirillaceae bacterium]MBT7611601.1 homoserine O-acetyltransferase [Rhodospirillaceae bacterium]